MRRVILKNLVITTISAAGMLNAYAVAPGFYMGLQTGPATNGSSTVQAQTLNGGTTPADPRSNQWGFGMFIGNKLNKYASIEGGFHYFTGIKYDSKNVATCSSTQARVRDVYIAGKGDVSYSSFDFYGKGGLSIDYYSTSGALNPDPSMPCGKSSYVTKFRPLFSIGASYDLNQSWVTDLSYNKLMVGGTVSSVTFYALGLSYHFVDRYCGQFLCDD